MEPFLKAFLLCDGFKENKETGAVDVIGIHQQLRANNFPLNVELRFFYIWANLDNKEYLMDIILTLPGEGMKVPLKNKFKTDGYGRYDYSDIFGISLPIPEPGDLTVEVLLDGKHFGSHRIPVLITEVPIRDNFS